MKKNKPAAKKGFSPFKESKSSTHKPAGSKSRPGAGDRSERSATGGPRKPATGDRPARPARSPKKEDDHTNSHSSFRDNTDRKGKRPVRSPKREDDNNNSRSSFGDNSDRKGKRPVRSTKREDDNSSFHGNFQSNGDGKPRRDTPSGFNRQKFFDRTNDRFADKQARKTDYKKHKKDDGYTGKPDRHSDKAPDTAEGMPLNKYIAHCGLCSRRKAVDFIKEGKVTVNGKPVLEPAFKVTAKDAVKISDKPISLQKNLVYILLNKPKGFITTTDDPEGRQTVMELVKHATDERVYPVGRLDRNTSGLLLLTNDGELAQKLAHPKHNIKKIYQVELDKPLTKADFEQIVQGVTLEDGLALVDALGYIDTKDKKQVGIEIHSGKNRIVRRIFEHLGYTVEKLDRVMYAGLTKKNINRGKWRLLSEKEVILLKHFK
jgi:23S rRNA pseudouridine2605 synthase